MINELYERFTHMQGLMSKKQLRGWPENGSVSDIEKNNGRIVAVMILKEVLS